MPTRRAASGARPEPLFQPPPERQPLAARMRPRTLEEFVGQAHLVGERGPAPPVGRPRPPRVAAPVGPARHRQDVARAAPRRGRRRRVPDRVSAVMSGVAEVRGDDRRGPGAARARAAPHRSCSSTRSTASTRRSRTRSCRTSRTARSRSSGRRPRTRTSRSTRRSCRGCACGGSSRSPTTTSRSSCAGRSRTRSAGSPGRSARPAAWPSTPEAFDHLVDLAGGDARQALNVLEGAVALAEDEDHRSADGRGLPHPRRRRVRRPAAGPRLRPRGRRPLRHRLRVHQEPPRQRPRRRAVLAGVDGRGRRGPAVHRPAADHRGVRGRRQRGSRARSRSPSPPPRRSTTSGCPRRSTRSPRRRSTSPTAPKSNRVGCRLLGGDGRRHRARLAARARLTSRTAGDRRMKAPRHRRRLPVPARLRGLATSRSSTCPTSSRTAATTTRPRKAASAGSAS